MYDMTKYFKYRIAARLDRLQYLLLKIIFLGIVIVVSLSQIGTPTEDFAFPNLIIFGAVFLALKIYITIPRLKDCNISGWWALIITPISLLIGGLPEIILLIWPGTKGENRYGSPSKTIWEKIA